MVAELGEYCPSCGYDLRGADGRELVRCPECGEEWPHLVLLNGPPPGLVCQCALTVVACARRSLFSLAIIGLVLLLIGLMLPSRGTTCCALPRGYAELRMITTAMAIYAAE